MKLLPALTALAAAVISLGCASGDGVANVLVVARVDVTPGSADVIIGGTTQLAAAPKTASGLDVPGRTPVWSSSDATIATVTSSGVVTGRQLGGPVRIKATVDGATGDALITVRPVPVDRVTVEPSTAQLLVAGTQQMTAKAFDATGALLTGRSFFWESNPSSIAAVTTTGIVIGLAEGGPVTISATAEGKTGSATVSVSTRPATRLGFVQQPGSAVAGQAMTPPVQVALQDDFLTTVIGAGNPVTIQLAGNPGGATLSGTTSVTPTNGIATFGTLSLNRVGTAYTFLVTSPGLQSATSNPFNVTVGSATQLGFTTAPPAAAQSGTALGAQPVLQLQDGSGNAVSQSGVVITASIASGPAGSTLGGGTSATTNGSGVAAFTNLSITGSVGTYTLNFTAPGTGTLTSGPISLGAGFPVALVIQTQPPSAAQSSVALSPQPAIQLRDAAGNPVPQAGIVVTASIASGPAGPVLVGATATTAGNGLASFTSLTINGPSGTYTLRFSAPGLTGVTSGPIVLGAGAPTQLAITTQPSSTAVNGVPLAQQPVVQLRDASNNPVALAGVQITATVSAGGSLSGTAVVNTSASGTAAFTTLVITGPVGSYTLTFTASGLTPATSGAITLSAGAASQLGIVTQPSAAAQSGVAFAQQPVVQLRDASGNPVSQNGTMITAALASGPGGATLGGTPTAITSSSGNASFANLSITGPSGTYTIRFTATGLTEILSAGVTLGAGSATRLTISTQPSSSAQSGVAFGQQPAIQLRDAADNPVAQAGVVITATIASGGGTLGGTATATTGASGIATFANLSISGTIGSRTLAFNATGLTGATSNTINLSAGPASQLAITTQPSSSAQSGVAFTTQPVIQLLDASGNAVSQSLVNVTAAIASGGGTLGGTATVQTDASGAARFTNLSLSGPTGNYSLGFSGPSLTGATSNTIALSAGSGSNLGITTQPSSTAQNTVAFPQQPVIQLRDAANNPVAQANVVVTAAINSGGGTLGGTASATTNASGVATFANLSITGTAGSRTLLFAANGYVSVASNPINVTAGPATKITVTTQPAASAQSGVPFTQQPVVQLRDVSDNAVSQSLVNITAAITSGGGTMGGTATVATNASGVATFAGLSITGTIGDRTLSFSSGVLDPAVSNPITLTAGPASQLTITTQPSATATSGTVFVQQPVIQLRDGAGNAVSQSGVMVTASVTSGPSATLGGTVTVSTNGSGVATYINLMLTGTAGSYTLGFAATGLTGATSSSITLSTSTASRLSITTQPSSTAQSGIAFGQQPAIQLRDASDNPVSQNGVVVTAAIASGGGTLGGTVTATTNGSGLATFTNLSITGTVGDHTLSFTAPSFTGVTSSTIALAAGAAAIIAANSVTTQTATVNTAVGAPPSVRVTDASSNAVAGVPVTFTLTAGGGTLSPPSPATISTDASGIATVTSWTLGSSAGTNNNTVTATATGLTGSPVTFTASGTAGTPTQITYITQPSGATNGVAFTTQPVLLVRDANNNNVPGAVVTAVISTAPAGSSNLIGSGTATTASNGRATFSGLGLIGPIGNYKLRFSTNAGALTSNESNTISLAAGAAAIITANSATTQSATVSTAVSAPPSVKVTDTGGNPKGSIAVTFTVTVTAGGGSLSPASPATINTNSSGIATVTSWTLGSTAGTNNNTVTATATGLTGSPVTFTASGTAGAPTQLAYNTQPSATANSGAAFATQPALLLKDAFNNPVGSTAVTATITGSPAGVTFVGTPTATTNGSGVATFVGLGLSGPVGSYTLTFTSGAANSGASNPIALSAGAPTQLTYNTQPSTTANSGAAFAQQPALLLRDAADNPVGSTLVTATITTSPGGGSFVGTPSATTNASGVATFVGLGLSGPVGNYKLTFTSGAATSVASSTIALSAGTAANITANSPTSQSATVGTPVAAPPSVKVTDAAGNPKAGVSVTFTMMAGGGTTVPASPATLTTDAGGVASLTSWVLGPTAGTNNNTVTATSTGLTGSPVTFTASGTAGAPTQMAITQQPSATATSNTVFAQQPIIQVTDANGNPVSGVSVTAAIQTGTGGTLGGTITQVTDSSGNATFTDLKITGLLTYTLRFSATGPPPVDSNIIIVSL